MARRLRTLSLGAKLMLSVVGLVALALAIISVASVSVLRGHLVGRVDAQLERIAADARSELRDERPVQDGFLPLRVPSDAEVELRAADGGIEASTSRDGSGATAPLPADAALLRERAGRPYTVAGWRVLVVPREDAAGHLVVSMSLGETERTISTLITIELVVSGLMLLLLATAAFVLIRASLRPLREIEATAAAIAHGDLSRRVPDRPERTEVGRLAAALNHMLGRLESAFRARAESEAAARRSEERLRRFVADAGHELRTPLTAIRGFAELYRRDGTQPTAERDRIVERIETRAADMGTLVEELQLLARLDRPRPLERTPVDLVTVVAGAVSEARVLAPERTIDLDVRGEAAYLIAGDEPGLRQVVVNLLENARRHTPPGTPVQVLLRAGRLEGRAAALLEVADRGPGLTSEQRERVFERFYRVDPSRSRHDGGSGLGLAIVAALVTAHDGQVSVDATAGSGCTFRVLLPLAND
jgi:two-component system, OmpR family, sensor kinase